MNFKQCLMSLAVLALAAPAWATHREDDIYERKRVAPGEMVTRSLGCAKGELTGGGYNIPGQPEDGAPFNVTANYPLADGRWRVDLRNISDTSQELTLRIYVLCTD